MHRRILGFILLNFSLLLWAQEAPAFLDRYLACEAAFAEQDWANVKTQAEEGIAFAESHGSPIWKAQFEYLLGGSLVYQSLIADAKPILAGVLEQEAQLPDSILCNTYYYLSTIYSYEDTKIARDWLAKTMESPWGQTPARQMRFLARMGSLIANEGYYDSALPYYKKAAKYGLLAGDTASTGRMTGNVGIIFTASAQMDSAQFYSQQGIQYLEASNKDGKNDRNLGFAYMQMGDILDGYEAERSVYNENWVAKAQDYYEKGAALLMKSPALRDQVLAHQSLANVHRERDEFDQAKTHLTEALALTRQAGMKPQEAEMLMELGDLAFSKNEFESSLEQFESAIPIMVQVEQQYSAAMAYKKAGTAANKLEQYSLAVGYLEEAIQLQKQFEFTSDLNSSYREMANARAGQGRFKEAFAYLESHEHLKDSLFNEEKNLQLTELETQYQTAQKDLKLAESAQQIKLRETQILGLGLIAGLFLLAGLGAFLAYRRIRSQKVKIEQQSLTLAANLKEKEVLLKEIHHRVKNNLQTISSLLKLQARKMEGKAALEPLLEGRNRVKSMALIHQKLYQNENLSQVDFQDYLLQLSTALANSYRHKGQDIKTHVEAPNISLDVDTAVPLGLIVNELLTNAYKYAFEGRAEGNIRLAIQQSQQAGEYQLSISDDGVGLPANFDPEQTDSLGMQLVHMFTEQLDGSLQWLSEQGSKFVLTFKPTFQQEAIG